MIIKILPKKRGTYSESDKLIPIRFLKALSRNSFVATEEAGLATDIGKNEIDSYIESVKLKWGEYADFKCVDKKQAELDQFTGSKIVFYSGNPIRQYLTEE